MLVWLSSFITKQKTRGALPLSFNYQNTRRGQTHACIIHHRRVRCHTVLHADLTEFLSMLYHNRHRNFSHSQSDCPNICVCGFMGGLFGEDNPCYPEHSWRTSGSPGVQYGCQRSPCLAGLHLKSCCSLSDCPLPPVYPLSSSLSLCHAHTHTHPHAPYIYSPIKQLCAATTVFLSHLCCLPTLGGWRVFDGQTHSSVYLLCLICSKHTTAWGWGWEVEWVACLYCSAPSKEI